MTIRILVAAVGIALLLANPGWAQSTTTFDSLSPGNQKIANALFSAQNTNGPNTNGPNTNGTTLTKDQIAALKGTEGWGRVFKQMKADGLVQAKNLGQVVSAHQHELNAARRGTTTANTTTANTSANTTTANASVNTRTTRSGRTTMAGSARTHGRFAAAGSTSGRSFAGSSHRMSGVAVSTMGRGGFGHGGMGGGFGHGGMGGGFGHGGMGGGFGGGHGGFGGGFGGGHGGGGGHGR